MNEGTNNDPTVHPFVRKITDETNPAQYWHRVSPVVLSANTKVMFLHIADTMTIEEVQDRFRECFPSLAIAFYHSPHRKGKASEQYDQYFPKEQLG